MPQVSITRLALLLLVVLGVFFTELGTARLWDRDEPRNTRASHEMLARGDWIVPTFNGSLRDHKPILLYWGQMLSFVALGESEFAARLPSALCALLSIVAVAVLASRLSGKSTGLSQEGFWAAGCMATCMLFVMAGRAATPDSCLIAFSTLGIAALVIGSLAPSAPYSSGRVTKTKWLAALIGYTMLGLAALAKGPVGIILPLTVVHVWWMICRRLQTLEDTRTASHLHGFESLKTLGLESWRTFNPKQCWRAVWALRTIPGLLLSLFAAAPWYVAVGYETHGAFLRGFFLDHNIGRALGSMEGHQGSLLFYPIAFLVGTFPWSLWLIPIIAWCRSVSGQSVVQRQMVVLAATWIAVYLLAFSAASTKLPSYITPCYAGAALILGGYWRQFENAWSRPGANLRGIAYVLTIAVGIGIAGGILWLSRHESMPLLARAATGGVIVSMVGVLGFLWERTAKTNWVPATWLMGAAAFQIVLFGYGTKSVDQYRQDLAMFDRLSPSTNGSHWLSIGGMEPSWVHYLQSEIVEVTASESDPRAWEQVDNFLRQFPNGKIVVVGEAAHERLLSWQANTGSRPLNQLAEAPRFLRPGNLRVFEQGSLRLVEPSSHSTEARVVAGPPATEPLETTEPNDLSPLPILRSAEAPAVYNPLRP